MLSERDTRELLAKFPMVEAAFAYGSGAVKQQGYQYTSDKAAKAEGDENADVAVPADGGASLPMVDLLLVVKDTEAWHKENIAMNREHYTILTNHKWVTYLQENLGGGMWFNAMLPMEITRFPRRSMKYGTISSSRFEKDCKQWTDLYIAGRCHKPIVVIKSNEKIDMMLEYNRSRALVAALCTLPPEFSEFQLYAGIASLSYMNDPRMGMGENPNKIINLVTPIIEDYRNLYAIYLASLAPKINLRRAPNEGLYLQDMSSSVRLDLVRRLPPFLKQALYSRCGHSEPISTVFIKDAIGSIVARSAKGQLIKGMITAGVFKGAQYVWAKVKKTMAAKVAK
jgi:translocator assembly and maintenance protein 41